MELIRSILSQLGVNSTFLYQFMLVVISYFLLSNLVFRPLLKILQTRHSKTKGMKEEAEKFEKEIQEIEEQYRVAWARIEKEGQKLLDSGDVISAREKAKEIVEKTEKDSNAKLFKARQQMDEIYKMAEAEGEKFIPSLAEDVKKKLLESREA
jgi:F0F1-type ATP synthase membrane subunit b/b'